MAGRFCSDADEVFGGSLLQVEDSVCHKAGTTEPPGLSPHPPKGDLSVIAAAGVVDPTNRDLHPFPVPYPVKPSEAPSWLPLPSESDQTSNMGCSSIETGQRKPPVEMTLDRGLSAWKEKCPKSSGRARFRTLLRHLLSRTPTKANPQAGKARANGWGATGRTD